MSTLSHRIVSGRLHVIIRRFQDHPGKKDLIFLHGFLGAGKQFEHLFDDLKQIINPVTFDFYPGDGEDPTEADSSLFSAEALATALHDGLTSSVVQPKPLIYGYSMGGRLALSWASRYPDESDGILLESSSCGIDSESERKERRASDAARAQKIMHDYPSFLKEWENLPLFTSSVSGRDKSTLHISQLHQIQQNQEPRIMAQWLYGFGSGTMPCVWHHLNEIDAPICLITGALDPKFQDLAAKIYAQRLFHPKSNSPEYTFHANVSGAGHRVHIDCPEACRHIIQAFCSFHGR
ncbi:alpha/beta fold hydrolase [Balneolaceae bacterium ANBcel3]|nr:alpha/beta fold hydrolase [Balneolaceae bacterium ANBcel3]